MSGRRNVTLFRHGRVYARFNESCSPRASAFFKPRRLSLGIRAMRTSDRGSQLTDRLVCHCRSWTWLRFDDADARWYADGHKKAKDEKIPGQQVGINARPGLLCSVHTFLVLFVSRLLSLFSLSLFFFSFYFREEAIRKMPVGWSSWHISWARKFCCSLCGKNNTEMECSCTTGSYFHFDVSWNFVGHFTSDD